MLCRIYIYDSVNHLCSCFQMCLRDFDLNWQVRLWRSSTLTLLTLQLKVKILLKHGRARFFSRPDLSWNDVKSTDVALIGDLNQLCWVCQWPLRFYYHGHHSLWFEESSYNDLIFVDLSAWQTMLHDSNLPYSELFVYSNWFSMVFLHKASKSSWYVIIFEIL